MLVQIGIVLLGLYLFYLGIASPATHSMRAGKKIALALLALLAIVAVLSPGLMNRLANLAGIGRGADLVLYALAGAFIFYVSNQYLHAQRHRDSTFRVARRLALLDARQRYAEHLRPPQGPDTP